MIKIEKPTEAPQRLLEKGISATTALQQAYEADAAAFANGDQTFEFDSKIYGHSTVKGALKKAQHHKCCFCERKTEIGDVEHFRPKAGYRQTEGEPLSKPGYYWLAYDWDNLLLSCATCNRSFKSNFFPLENPGERATSHHDDIEKEKPLVIHPAKENPEEFTEFYGVQARPINGNQKGKETIKRTGLNRSFLYEERKAHYEAFEKIFELAEDQDLPLQKRQQLFQIIKAATHVKKEYAGMIRCAIRHQFRY